MTQGVQRTPGKGPPHAPKKPLYEGEIPMASVPQTPATPESFTTLVAELYGDQVTRAPQLPANGHATDDRWHDAVT